MLVPQFSIRWMLAVTALCAVAFSLVALAMRGHRWALAISVGVGSLGLMMAVYAAAFGLVWLYAVATDRPNSKARRSGSGPFSRRSSEESAAAEGVVQPAGSG